MSLRDRGVEIKTPDQIEQMRAAGLVVGRTLELLRDAVKAGITTGELDALAEDHILSSGATPSAGSCSTATRAPSPRSRSSTG